MVITNYGHSDFIFNTLVSNPCYSNEAKKRCHTNVLTKITDGLRFCILNFHYCSAEIYRVVERLALKVILVRSHFPPLY